MARVDLSAAEVGIYSLSSKNLSPLPTYEFDVNRFRDPIGNRNLTSKCVDGRDGEVKKWIRTDPRFLPILETILLLCEDQVRHGEKKWISFGFRDHHGKWISRALAELVADELANVNYSVGVLHAATT